MDPIPFVPVSTLSRNRKTIEVGDIVGVMKNHVGEGRIGIVDHIYKNNSNLTYFVIRYPDGSSESVSSARFYDVGEVNSLLKKMINNNNKAVKALQE